MKTKKISILGSTGSIGTQTLELVDLDPELTVSALAARGSLEALYQQIRTYGPQLACLYEEEKAEELRKRLKQDGISCRVVSGMEGLCEAAACSEADTTVVAVVGMIGIQPTMAAIRAGKKLALANKETLVCAGHLIMSMVQEYGTELLPVDSEHSAIAQCLAGEPRAAVEKLLLTASGGPFRGCSREQLQTVRPQDALRHPNWSMGAKITIDSSTMVNKALEVMEARWLFDVPMEDIEIVIQPQSVIHSMVQFQDGAVKAQLGVPSMRIPIAYALYAPDRRSLPAKEKLDFSKLLKLDFSVPDLQVFGGLRLGLWAGKTGGSMPTVFNAANEEAVSAFLSGAIPYLGIEEGIEAAMRAHRLIPHPALSEILAAEQEARAIVRAHFGL